MLTIRKASSAEHLQSAVAIQLQVFFEEQGIDPVLCRKGNRDAWHVLAFDGDEPVATARLRRGPNREGELARVAVLPSHRSGGIGQDLVRALEQIALDEGLASIVLHPHQYLEAFYSKLGYTRVNDWTEDVSGHNLIRMRKSISD